MKKILIAIIAGFFISASMPTIAQHHRHTPVASMKINSHTDNDGNTKNTTAIVAFSDTADMDTADIDTNGVYDDDWAKHKNNFDALSDIMEKAFMPISITFIMFFLAPVMIIGLIIYYIIKSRKQKIQLAELALKNGQPIPQDIVNNKLPNNQELWAKGIKKIFLGIGIVIFSIFVHSKMCTGIGFIIAFYGAGQAVIAWTTKKNIFKNQATYNEAKEENNYNKKDESTDVTDGENEQKNKSKL